MTFSVSVEWERYTVEADVALRDNRDGSGVEADDIRITSITRTERRPLEEVKKVEIDIPEAAFRLVMGPEECAELEEALEQAAREQWAVEPEPELERAS